MLIGELARRAGLRRSTVRYYERVGLLRPPPRTPGGYRDYDDDALARVRFIQAARSLGLRLDEIVGVLSIRESGGRPCSHVLGMLEGKVRELSEEITELEARRADLERVIRHGAPVASGESDLCPLIERGRPRASASSPRTTTRRATA